MPSKTSFGPETVTIQRHTQYSVQAVDGQYYKVNAPLTLAHLQDGVTYTVQGSVSQKGHKYISEILNATQTAPQLAPQQQTAALPPLPPAPIPQFSASPPVSPTVNAEVKYKDNIEGKVACALGAGLLASLSNMDISNEDLVKHYVTVLPEIVKFHKDKGWV